MADAAKNFVTASEQGVLTPRRVLETLELASGRALRGPDGLICLVKSPLPLSIPQLTAYIGE